MFDMRQDRYDQRGQKSLFVRELETGYVVVGDNRHFKGYVLFLYKEHKKELFQLDHSTKMKFLEEMSVVAEAVSNAFHAEKMNCELLGMGDAHLHWHLFPRRSGDIGSYGNNGKGPGGIRRKRCTAMTTDHRTRN